LSGSTNESDVTAHVSELAARHFAAAIGSPPLAITLANTQAVISWEVSVNGFVLQSIQI
jgi:hypothetical protein